MNDLSIKIYSTPTCVYCRQAESYFDGKGLKYEKIDISKSDKDLQEMLSISGQMSVPVIVVRDAVSIGFNKRELSRILDK